MWYTVSWCRRCRMYVAAPILQTFLPSSLAQHFSEVWGGSFSQKIESANRCCYITVDPATPALWNGVSHFGVLLNRPRCLMLPSLKWLYSYNTLLKTILFLDELSRTGKKTKHLCLNWHCHCPGVECFSFWMWRSPGKSFASPSSTLLDRSVQQKIPRLLVRKWAFSP